jgi:hypothetical protein
LSEEIFRSDKSYNFCTFFIKGVALCQLKTSHVQNCIRRKLQAETNALIDDYVARIRKRETMSEKVSEPQAELAGS